MARTAGHPVDCACGSIHRLSPSALEIAVQAFIDGDAQRMSSNGVISMCIQDLLSVLDHRKRKDRVRVA